MPGWQSHLGGLGCSHKPPFVTRSAAIQSPIMLDCSSVMNMRWREVLPLGIGAVLLSLVGCGSPEGPSSDDSALAARGRASLVATFTETSYRLPPLASPACVEDRRRTKPQVADMELDVYCSLNAGAMRHLRQRLDQGIGEDATAAQRSCITGKVTRDQIAALLTAELGAGGDSPVAAAAEFDDQLASVIRQCTGD